VGEGDSSQGKIEEISHQRAGKRTGRGSGEAEIGNKCLGTQVTKPKYMIEKKPTPGRIREKSGGSLKKGGGNRKKETVRLGG